MSRSSAAPDEETFGEMVRKLRDRMPGRVSQAKLAEIAGVSERTVQNIEGGAPDPETKTVRGLAGAFGLPVSTLSRKLGWIPIEEAEQNWLLKGLDEEDQQMVLEMIGRLKEPSASVRSRRRA